MKGKKDTTYYCEWFSDGGWVKTSKRFKLKCQAVKYLNDCKRNSPHFKFNKTRIVKETKTSEIWYFKNEANLKDD